LATEENIQTFSLNGHEEPVIVFKNSFAEANIEIQEIISAKPPVIVRWGTVFFLLLLILLAGICRFIEYPDLVTASARLNSINAPKEVVSRAEGKLHTLLVKNGAVVQAQSKIGYIESIAKPAAIEEVKRRTDSIVFLIGNNRTNEVIHYLPDYSNQEFLNNLGELQQPFQVFMKSFIDFKDYISNGFYLRRRNMLQTDANNIQRLHVILTGQKKLLEEDVSLSKETFTANESLANEKVIAPIDYRNEKSKFIAKKLSLPQVNSSIVNNEAQQNEKQKEIAQLENQINAQKNIFIQALQTFRSQIEEWEFKYVLRAPVSGKLLFNSFLQENQQIKSNQMLMYVEPDNTSYFAEVLIPQYNFGKIKEGQQVLLKFQAYPFEQFGSVQGKVEYISSIPSDSGFLAKVVFANGLRTNYNKQLQYRNGLQAQAEIITENMNLIERFYYNFRKQLKR
jgi:biotin carboxyl carrier protein